MFSLGLSLYNERNKRRIKSGTKVKNKNKMKSMTSTQRYLKRYDQFIYSINNIGTEAPIINLDITLKENAYFILENGQYKLVDSITNNDSVVAYASIIRDFSEKGWDKLKVNSFNLNGKVDAFVQSYLAGMAEGRITAEEINKFIIAKDMNNPENKQIKKIIEFFEQVHKNLTKKILELKNVTDKNEQITWIRMLLGYSQLRGVYDGYQFEKNRKKLSELSIGRLLLIQADGELPELKKAFKYLKLKESHEEIDIKSKHYFENVYKIKSNNPNDIWRNLMSMSRCSALIKVIKDNKGNLLDLYVAHNTWGEAIELIRIYKYHKLELEGNSEIPSVDYTFSGYPGTLSSTDDFYVTKNGLVVTETTIEVIDINLYSNVKHSDTYLPNYMRVLSATRFSKSAEEWVNNFSYFNSGTYSSQWMILDYQQFYKVKNTSNKPEKMFFVLEQVPDKIINHDLTDKLISETFFGSYNRAFFTESNESLHNALLKNIYGDLLSDYKASRRGKQFQYLQPKIVNMKTMIEAIRYNGYKLNNFKGDSSNDNPSDAISARYDLDNNNHFIGGVDSKLVNSELVSKMSTITINGPADTRDNPNLKDYILNDNLSKLFGIKPEFKFPYLLISPESFDNKNINDKYDINKS